MVGVSGGVLLDAPFEQGIQSMEAPVDFTRVERDGETM